MSVWSDRIGFLSETRSVASLSREVRIPYSTYRRIASGVATPTTTQKADLTNQWKRGSYARLRESGISASQAERFRGGAVSTVRGILSSFNTLLDTLATGALQSQTGFVFDPSDPDVVDDWLDLRGQIAKGIEGSERTYEEWQDYPR